MIYFHWIYLLVYALLTIPTVVAVLMDNKQPAKTIAWIMVLLFMPFLGIVLYVFFGQDIRKQRLISNRSMTSSPSARCWSLLSRRTCICLPTASP